MGIKLKNFSRQPGAKAVVYTLIVLMVVGFTAQLLAVGIAERNGSLNMECLYTEWYESSGSLYDDMYGFYRHIDAYDGVSTSEFYYSIMKNGIMESNVVGKAFTARIHALFNENGSIILMSVTSGPGDSAGIEPVRMADLLAQEPDAVACIAMTDQYLDARQAEWQEQNRAFLPYIILGILQVLIFIALLVLVAFMAGRRAGDDELHPAGVDRIYSDIMAAAVMTVIGFWALICAEIIRSILSYGTRLDLSSPSTTQILMLLMLAAVTITAAVIALTGYLSFIRKIKAKKLLKHTLVFTVWNRLIWHFIKSSALFLLSFVDGRRFNNFPFVKRMFYKQLAYAVMQGVLLFFVLLAITSYEWGVAMLFVLAIAALTLLHIRSNNKTFEDITKLCDQIREVNAGDLLYLPPMSTASPLYESRKLLAKIGSGLQNSVDKAVKSERMKIDLITNVSHDLKTPLTSIISYIDLLNKEEDLPPEAKEYVRILIQKSDRLKQIVSDLFDLAKTTSGNAEVNLEKLDLKKLIEQTMVDMEDRFADAGRVLRTRLPEKAVMIQGDGKKLYRVLQNLLDNALKYSQEGSRIFVELDEKNGKAFASVKNIAADEMDFTATEVMERFNRGDKTRSTDGSGLGLSIAESFTRASGGLFSVSVDGDLFKAVMQFDITL